jgi:catechol 2,3-dioxygenase-like lactoylglutathione lyase family enzyme
METQTLGESTLPQRDIWWCQIMNSVKPDPNPKISALSILHAVITVSDMDGALEFYHGLLGLEIKQDIQHDPRQLGPLLNFADPDVRAVILRCPDGSEIELAEFRRPRGDARVQKRFEDAGITFISLTVEDLDITVRQVQEAGYSVHGAVSTYHEVDHDIRLAYCYGPDGTGLTFVERLTEPRSRGQ